MPVLGLQAIEGVGINWSFAAGEADEQAVHTLPVRVCACLVSIGGMLVTALMLSIVSGKRFSVVSVQPAALITLQPPTDLPADLWAGPELA